MIKILLMREDGEIGENFLLAKISVYTILGSDWGWTDIRSISIV